MDDLDAFGSEVPDLEVLCTTNEIRDEEWVFLKGEYPFRIGTIYNLGFGNAHEGFNAVGFRGGKHIQLDGDQEKREVMKGIQRILRDKYGWQTICQPDDDDDDEL